MLAATQDGDYRGRFAPSPTGPLHFGSLVAALGSWLDSRGHGGSWMMRMEDLDRPRVVPGSADLILRTLEAFGLDWDEAVLYQNARSEAYAQALEHLGNSGLLFPCTCSRRQLGATGRMGPEGPIYPGTCRRGPHSGRQRHALRVRTRAGAVGFRDRIQGESSQDVEREVGDFVLKRADGIFSYQLAVVVDDAFQGVTRVVRGADLLRSTPRQIFLQRELGLTIPEYAHLPLVVDAVGRKLSKSNAAAPVDPTDPLPALLLAWRFLDQVAFPEFPANLSEFYEHALGNWDTDRVPSKPAQPSPDPVVVHAGSKDRAA